MADKKASKKVENIEVKTPKVVTSAKIEAKRDLSSDALEEITLLKDHGQDKKGDKLMKHPNMVDILKQHKIAK